MDWDCVFVGRDSFFEILLERWEEVRCLGVYGMRSIGKSRFVKQLLSRTSKQYCDNDYMKVWIDMRNFHSLRQILLKLAEKLNILAIDDEQELHCTVLASISKLNQNFWITLDNAEDLIDSDLKNDFKELCKQIINQNVKVKVFVTSTSHLHSTDFSPEDGYFDLELPPLTIQESKELLQKSAPSVDFGDYFDKIVELCEGLPLALLLTGSELDQEDCLLKPCDMVELLNKCRLKVLSQDLYPLQERIAPMYRQFLNRLSSILKEKLGILSYIPGTFSLQQATTLLDEVDEVDVMKETLIPIYQRHVVQFDTPSQRFDIHGILKECIKEFLKIQNLPEVRTRYCKMFAELLKEIGTKMESNQYAEALCMYNMEQQNFYKLMTDVEYTTEETYPVYVDLATTAFPTVNRFGGVDSFTFIEKVLKLTRNNKRDLDEAFVSVTYANVLTNLKGDFIEGEQNYSHSISVMAEYDLHNCIMKVKAYQGLGWNLGSQGRPIEAINCLKKALQMETEMGMENEELMLQTLQSLAVFHTFAGFLDDGEIYHHKVLKKRRKLYGTDENPAIGACFNNMGLLYRIKGDYSKALEYFNSGLDIKRKTNATDKALVLSINNVAITLSDLNEHDKGIQILREAFEIIDKYPGFLTDCYDLTNDTIGQIYLRKCDYNRAIKYFERGIQGRLKSSPTHICVLEETSLLAKAYVGLKKYDMAETILLKILKHKDDFIKKMPQNIFVYDSYKTLMEVSKYLKNQKVMECYFIHCKAELYRLMNFYEDLGNLTKSNEMAQNLKSIETMYREFKQEDDV